MNGQYWFDPEPVLAHVRDLSAAEAAERLGVCRGSVNAWRQGRKMISWRKADELAGRLGAHPFDLWGWDWVTAAEVDDVAA